MRRSKLRIEGPEINSQLYKQVNYYKGDRYIKWSKDGQHYRQLYVKQNKTTTIKNKLIISHTVPESKPKDKDHKITPRSIKIHLENISKSLQKRDSEYKR